MQAVVRVRRDLWKRSIRDTGRACQRDAAPPVRKDVRVKSVPITPAAELAGAEHTQDHRYARTPSRRGRRRRWMRSYGGAMHRPHVPFVVRF
jgi:hypothetical protein